MPVLTLTTPNIPMNLRGPIALSSYGLPHFWPTIYTDIFNAHLKFSTRNRLVRALDQFYAYGATMSPRHDADTLLSQRDVTGIKNYLSGYLTHMIGRSEKGAVGVNQHWQTVFAFCYKILRLLGVSAHKASSFHAAMHDLKALYDGLTPARAARRMPIRALPAIVIEDIDAILEVGSPRNPFRCMSTQHRNRLVFDLLLRLGLRRGELLSMGLDSLKHEYDPKAQRPRFWLNITDKEMDDDPRFLRASIKNDISHRVIPVPENLANQIHAYIYGHRGRQDHPFLISSAQAKPLSARAVTDIFHSLTKCLSANAKQALSGRGIDHVQPHDLRHTAVVARLQMFQNAKVQMTESLERLRPYFGWSHGSKMPIYYGRAFFLTQFDDIWSEQFEDHVLALRAMKGSVQ